MIANKETALRPMAKFDQACAQLSQMAYALGADARMPTFANLCEQTGVSKATLDAALGQLEAQGIVMRRQGSGIFVGSTVKRGIALVCAPHFSGEPHLRDFWDLIVREARRRVAGSPYNLTFHFSSIETETATDGPLLHPSLVDDIAVGRVQGALMVGVPWQASDWMRKQGVAVVEFSGPGPVSVNMEAADVAKVGVEALVARGCQRIALWSEMWKEPGRDQRERSRKEAKGFQNTLAAHGLKLHKEWLRPAASEANGRPSYEMARDWVSEIFGAPRKQWPDGLLIANDILTRDVMAALQKLDIVPNQDIIIASHANTDSPVLQAYEDDLILVEYDTAEIVQTMFRHLETLLRGEQVENPRTLIVPKVRITDK
jgi:DNA-binding LacI/PurR family transcriptional regulator